MMAMAMVCAGAALMIAAPAPWFVAGVPLALGGVVWWLNNDEEG